jgi:hypothetical protein
MTAPKPTPKTINERKDWRDKFDELFYQKNRVWYSRSGESYGSETPEMGRGELFRFIQSTLTQQLEEVEREARELIEEYEVRKNGKRLLCEQNAIMLEIKHRLSTFINKLK